MRKRVGQSAGTAAWIDQELAGCEFADVRLGKRFKTLVARLAEGVGESIPMACQDWAATKADYLERRSQMHHIITQSQSYESKRGTTNETS
jgi:hypothetical protein